MIENARGPSLTRGAAPGHTPEGRCNRCGGARRLIVDDGPAVCRICLMAWASLARAVTTGETIAEPDIAAMRHLDHRRPQLDCRWCRQGGAAKLLGRLDERSRPL